jgi:Icc protein
MVRIMMGIILLSLCSCKKYIEFSPDEVRLDASEKNLNQKNIQKLESMPAKSAFKFVVTGDSQRFYEELESFVASINQRNDISFVVLNGDITDFGQNKEFKWVYERLSKLKVPFVGVIGNHDMLANGHVVFNEMFGPDNFSFYYSGCKFVCLNTNSREKGFDGSLPNLPWLKNQLADPSNYEAAFVISHVPPFNEDFDSSLSQAYASILAANKKVGLSIHSHEHHYSLSRPYGDEVEYLVTGSMNERHYVVVSVNSKAYAFERVVY